MADRPADSGRPWPAKRAKTYRMDAVEADAQVCATSEGRHDQPYANTDNRVPNPRAISGSPRFTKRLEDITRNALPSPWYLTGQLEPIKQVKANMTGAVRNPPWISGPPQHTAWVKSLQAGRKEDISNASYGSVQPGQSTPVETRTGNIGTSLQGNLGSPWSPKREKGKVDSAVQSAAGTSSRPYPAEPEGSTQHTVQALSMVSLLSLRSAWLSFH